jgi:hypothetical protein
MKQHNGGHTKQQLRREIEVTRGRIAEEVDAISEKLTPEHIKQAMKTKVKETTMEVGHKITDAGRNVGRKARARGEAMVVSAKEHPLRTTTVLIGLALILGWLLSRNERVRSGARTIRYRAGNALGAAKEKVAHARERIAHRRAGTEPEAITGLGPSSTGVLPGEWYEGQGYESQGLVGGVESDFAGEVESRSRFQRPREMAHRAGERVGHVYHATEQRIENAWHRNPLAVGAIVFAAGFGIGLALSATRTERRVLGPAGQRLGEKARELKEKAVHAMNEGVESVATRIEEGGKGTPEGGGTNRIP